MVVDALLQANNYLDITSHIHDPSQFWKVWIPITMILLCPLLLPLTYDNAICTWMQLDDTIIKTIETAPDQELKTSRDLILRIRRRNLYQVLMLLTYNQILT